jgi:hypothetical protein
MDEYDRKPSIVEIEIQIRVILDQYTTVGLSTNEGKLSTERSVCGWENALSKCDKLLKTERRVPRSNKTHRHIWLPLNHGAGCDSSTNLASFFRLSDL